MALIVKIFVNEKQILDCHAVRFHGQPGQHCIYRTGGKTIINHHYDSGAVRLAIKILQKYIEENEL